MKIKKLTMTAVFSALCAICAWINIPFIVPFTMQTFAVFLACLILGGCNASISLVVYILLGAVGLPVFSGFKAGLGVLLGATGGYIVGFPVLCLVYALIVRLMKSSSYSKPIGLTAGLAVLYLFGTVWFVLGYTGGGTMTFAAAAMKCVVPFIIPDLLKMLLALFVSKRVVKAIGTI